MQGFVLSSGKRRGALAKTPGYGEPGCPRCPGGFAPWHSPRSVMSSRAGWPEEWCPECSALGVCCRSGPFPRRRAVPVRLHVAPGWRVCRCPTCKEYPGEPCRTASGRGASRPHAARFRPRIAELPSRRAVCHELERRGATVAVVLFSGRAGQGGGTATITLSRLEGDDFVGVEGSTGRGELAHAFEAPVWDR